MKKIIQHISLFAIFISIVSCGGSGKNPSDTLKDSTEVKVKTDNAKDIIMYNIPSPIETFTILKISGSGFDKSLLNPTDKISKYVSNFSKAINLGVYSTDLSFTFLYKQNQEFNNYLKNINELTGTLGIDGSYGDAVTKRLQTNSNNLDSLMAIVTEASVNANIYLKENQRNNTTALIAAGAWVEAMHIISIDADKTQKQELIGLVADQKIVLKNLIKMLDQFESEKEIADLLKDIKDLSTLYDTLKQTQGTATASDDKSIISIGNNSSYALSKEQLKSILEKVESLRNKLTN
jgi:hypothetical protein